MLLVPPKLAAAPAEPSLDATQRYAMDMVLAGHSVAVLGAPGTGKTETLRQVALDRLGAGVELIMLCANRRAAAQVRDELSQRLVARGNGQLAHTAPLVRTASSLAFAILKQYAQATGERPPTLITGPEQDRILAELLAGHLSGDGVALRVPPGLSPAAMGMAGFRHELRDLLMRLREYEVTPSQLARLAAVRGEPMWALAAEIFAEYEACLALRAAGAESWLTVDPAQLIGASVRALQCWPHASGFPRPHWQLVLVDDYQEATAATAALIAEVQAAGSQIVVAGCPDTTTQGYRGADPRLLAAALGLGAAPGPAPGMAPGPSAASPSGLEPAVLGTAWRQTPELRAATAGVAERIPVAGGPTTRRAAATAPSVLSPEGATVGSAQSAAAQAYCFESAADEAAWIARELRSERILSGTPWRRMAVIAKSGSVLRELRRALVAAGVPVETAGAGAPLHQQLAVTPVLAVLDVSAGQRELTEQLALELLQSPLGGLDAIGLRRLRRALRSAVISGGGEWDPGDFGRRALNMGAELALPPDVALAVRAVTNALAAGRSAVADGFDSSTALWKVWAAVGLADRWQRVALAGGEAGAAADRDLDAMMALFKAAEFFVERNPGAGVEQFIADLTSQGVAADSVARVAAAEGVAVLTPAAAAGFEWDVVVVARVQDGIWPDIRLRDTLLGTARLVEVLRGGGGVSLDGAPGDELRARRAEVLSDELRSFVVAISRATHRLAITAIQNSTEDPSPLIRLAVGEPTLVAPGLPMDMRGLVTRARQLLLVGGADADGAAELLAGLAAAGVAEADPDTWYGAAAVSTDQPLWLEGESVPVSPSKIEAVALCPLAWMFEAAGASRPAPPAAGLGTLIHSIAQSHPQGTASELRAELARRWPELGLGVGWRTDQMHASALAMVDKLAQYFAAAPAPAGVEAPFEVELDGATLMGRVDRLEGCGAGKYRVIDFKTGSTIATANAAAEHPQLMAYQLAVAAGGFPSLDPDAQTLGADLVFVSGTTKGPSVRNQPALTESQVEQAKLMVQQTAQTMSASSFLAKSNSKCATCAARLACPAVTDGQGVIP